MSLVTSVAMQLLNSTATSQKLGFIFSPPFRIESSTKDGHTTKQNFIPNAKVHPTSQPKRMLNDSSHEIYSDPIERQEMNALDCALENVN